MRTPARLLPLLLLVGTVGCLERPEFDTEPPRVLHIEPSGAVVPVDVSFRVTFSEPLTEETVLREDDGHTVVLIPRASATSAFISDMNIPPLIDSRQEQVVPAEVRLSNDATEITLKPLRNLPADTAFTLLVSRDVRDLAGNPLFGASSTRETFRYDVTTDDGPPVLTKDDVGSGLVWPNRKRFTVSFNQAVRGLSADTIAIEPVSEGAFAPEAEALLISEGRDEASLFLADGQGCERLTPNAEYELRIGPGLKDDEGEGMEEERIPFTTGPSCDETPLVLLGAPDVVATDVRATVRLSTNKASTTEIRYGRAGGPLDCLGELPCPAPAPSATSPVVGSAPPAFERVVTVEGLVVDEEYKFLIRAEDEVGSVVLHTGSFVTAPLPKVAINEIMGDTPVPQDRPGEYVELVNFGEEAVDLSDWSLEIGQNRCWLPLDGPWLEPGDFLLIVPGSFTPDFYDVDPLKTEPLPIGGAYLCGTGIPNNRVTPIRLYAEDGRPVSTFEGYQSVNHGREGRSVERVEPDAPDAEESWCYSREDHGYTPLADNGVMLRGCE